MEDLVIIGGGPAGVAAGVYAARKKIKTVLITDSFGGQSLVSADIQNWIGDPSLTGFELAQKLEKHLKAQEDIKIVESDLVSKIETMDSTSSPQGGGFRVETKQGTTLETRTVLMALGSRRRRLGVPGEDKFEGKGVVFCSTCDAPLFKDKVTAVVGGGNAGLEAVRDLLSYASKIYLVVRSDALKGDPITQDTVKQSPKVDIIYNAETQEILGDGFVTALRYKDKASGGVKELKLDGVFVEIGSVPNSDLVKDVVERNERGEIVVDHKTQRTSLPGIWAAGDVSDVLYKQNNVSVGDAVKAVLNIYDYLHKEVK
ncbi:MAG: Alkyl hydroperoxide reductase subunit F [Parcubacteria group bacterium GW2011_GWA1_60_11]|nr:MAG: Alkyl hydroperoxide reductase subunit F [Parcubacteria group bacterium GW2011_GWA1_60_11]